jgi:hypothetical protein
MRSLVWSNRHRRLDSAEIRHPARDNANYRFDTRNPVRGEGAITSQHRLAIAARLPRTSVADARRLAGLTTARLLTRGALARLPICRALATTAGRLRLGTLISFLCRTIVRAVADTRVLVNGLTR